MLVFTVLRSWYIAEAGRAYERQGLSARGSIVELSFDWLTLQTLVFKVPTHGP